MNWTRLSTPRAKLLSHATLALGLWIAPTLSALGYERPCRPSYQCPPGWRYQDSAPRSMEGGAMPQAPRQPGETDPMTGQPMDQQGQQDQQPQAPQQDFSQAPSSSRASLSPGADTPQLGRLDFANRMNLFDNMTAAPQTKIWFGYQQSSGINTGVAMKSSGGIFPILPGGQTLSDFTAEQRQANYRVGAEWAMYDDFSIAVQGQYYENLGDDSAFDGDWSQPQILAKYVVCRDCDTILTGTFGFQPETGVGVGDFEEATTRLYPGMLYYETLNREWFTQGGFQFGIPTENDAVTTFDWSLSLGYWLYRDCHADCCCSSAWITGIIPQIGLLGKHVIGDNTIADPFGFGSSSAFGGGLGGVLVSNEASDVLDLTAGTLIIIDKNVQVGLGYSLPLTDNEVRESEFITYVNYLF